MHTWNGFRCYSHLSDAAHAFVRWRPSMCCGGNVIDVIAIEMAVARRSFEKKIWVNSQSRSKWEQKNASVVEPPIGLMRPSADCISGHKSFLKTTTNLNFIKIEFVISLYRNLNRTARQSHACAHVHSMPENRIPLQRLSTDPGRFVSSFDIFYYLFICPMSPTISNETHNILFS